METLSQKSPGLNGMGVSRPVIDAGVFKIKVAYDDLAGATDRTELTWDSSASGYALGTEYWLGFRFKLSGNIRNASATDELIFWQVHDNNNVNANLHPAMSLIAHGGGASSSITLSLNYGDNIATNPNNNRIVMTVPYEADRWYTYVMDFKPHYAAGNGAFFKLWVDGVLLVNDTQPNDYNCGQATDVSLRSYQKLGLYHYSDTEWVSGDVRSATYGSLFCVQSDGTVTEPKMRAAVESNDKSHLPALYLKSSPSVSIANGVDAFRLQVMGVHTDDLPSLEGAGYAGTGGRANFKRL
jgi:hypothetical protein